MGGCSLLLIGQKMAKRSIFGQTTVFFLKGNGVLPPTRHNNPVLITAADEPLLKLQSATGESDRHFDTMSCPGRCRARWPKTTEAACGERAHVRCYELNNFSTFAFTFSSILMSGGYDLLNPSPTIWFMPHRLCMIGCAVRCRDTGG